MVQLVKQIIIFTKLFCSRRVGNDRSDQWVKINEPKSSFEELRFCNVGQQIKTFQGQMEHKDKLQSFKVPIKNKHVIEEAKRDFLTMTKLCIFLTLMS